MSRTTYSLWVTAVFVAIAGLILIGQRIAPPQRAANSAEARQSCKVESPDELKSHARYWCAIGLFSHVTLSTKDDHLIAVLQLSQNGAQAWQMQGAGLVGEFRQNTDRMAAEAKGKNISVDVHDPSDERIAACARLSTEAEAKCEVKK